MVIRKEGQDLGSIDRVSYGNLYLQGQGSIKGFRFKGSASETAEVLKRVKVNPKLTRETDFWRRQYGKR